MKWWKLHKNNIGTTKADGVDGRALDVDIFQA